VRSFETFVRLGAIGVNLSGSMLRVELPLLQCQLSPSTDWHGLLVGGDIMTIACSSTAPRNEAQSWQWKAGSALPVLEAAFQCAIADVIE
jgi:hypothetical protein